MHDPRISALLRLKRFEQPLFIRADPAGQHGYPAVIPAHWCRWQRDLRSRGTAPSDCPRGRRYGHPDTGRVRERFYDEHRSSQPNGHEEVTGMPTSAVGRERL